jgi:uncharacterized protein with beta-barrel porin domain
MLFVRSVIVALTVWSPLSFAQQVINGAAPTALSPIGVTSGVAMTGQGGGGTLNVGSVGGPELDIFTNNSSNGSVSNPALQAVSTDSSSHSNIVFNSSSTVFGAIGVTQPGGPFFLNISGGNTGTTIKFLGNVFSTTLNVTGTGSVNFNSGSTNITATNFAGDGTISLAPNTTVIGALTTNTADTGTLSLGGGSVLNGAVGGANGLRAINVVGGSNLAGVSATTTGATNAYAFSLGTNTLNVGGALTIANGGTGGVINTTLASPTLYGNIRPVGATNLGPTLQVIVTVPSTTFIPVGSKFNIVQTQAGTLQSGTNGTIINVTDPTNPLYTFSAVPVAGTIAGLVEIQTTGIPLLAPLAPRPGVSLPPAAPIAAVLVPVLLSISSSPDVNNVLSAINSLSDSGAVVNAVAQLAPSTPDLAAPLVTFQGARDFQDIWLTHMDTVWCEARQPSEENPTCSGKDEHNGWWLKAFGYFGDQGSQDAYPGYQSQIIGTMLAYDVPLGPDTRAGLGIGYAQSRIDGKTFDNTTDIDTYQATAYIGHQLGAWFVDGSLSYGWNNYSGTRNIIFPGIARTANAGYSGQDYTALLSTGYHFSARELTITPLASLQYTHMNLDGYSETGAGDINLNVQSQSYDFLETGLGVKASHDFIYRDGAIVPDIHFMWLHELIGPSLEQTASFAVAGSPSFTTPEMNVADDTFKVGAGLTLLSCECSARKLSLEAVYDYYWTNDSYSAQQVMMRLTSRF